ncbi:hypothetical protein [Acrocarpospora macrocephala]|nr:hypothetical protein [Acrocarpospora macrocephala]
MRLGWGCLAALLVPLAGLFVLVMIPMWRDNARLEALYERVTDYPRPPNTRLAYYDRDMTLGRNLSGGSGDYCDYRVRITLLTTLQPEEIRRHYSKALIAGAEDNARISLFFEDPVDGESRVVVEVFDSHGSDWDWRCT